MTKKYFIRPCDPRLQGSLTPYPMASVLSESSSSTGTATISTPISVGSLQFRPLLRSSKRDSSSRLFGEEPTQAQVRLNKLVVEALHGESSLELRNAELGRAAARALVNIGINQALEEKRRAASTRMDIDPEPEKLSTELKEEWKSIQDYGLYLKDAAITVHQSDPFVSQIPDVRRDTPTSSTETSNRPEEFEDISPLDWLSWKHFRFNAVFAHLAPLTSRENRIYAMQSAKLIDWIRDWGNDALFGTWQGLDQVVDSPPQSEETRLYRESIERAALDHILDVAPSPDRQSQQAIGGELGWRPGLAGKSENLQSAFARYISQDAPPPSNRPETRVTSAEPSRSSSFSMGGSEDDTRSIVSQDNHWRRTIFG